MICIVRVHGEMLFECINYMIYCLSALGRCCFSARGRCCLSVMGRCCLNAGGDAV